MVVRRDPTVLPKAHRHLHLEAAMRPGTLTDLAAHPLPQLLAAGVRCSINADAPILFGPGIGEEYLVARDRIGLTDRQLADCAWSSVEAGAASDDLKTRARAGIDAWLTGEDAAPAGGDRA